MNSCLNSGSNTIFTTNFNVLEFVLFDYEFEHLRSSYLLFYVNELLGARIAVVLCGSTSHLIEPYSALSINHI